MLNKTTLATLLTFTSAFFVTPSAIAQQTVVGSIPAEFTVSGGTANYSIPISVAPGRGGMQPELSLNYSSGGGNGVLGVGWSLGGLSAIHRCPRTIAQDGQVGGINFDENDRYCLDGQRLIPVVGNNGSIGAEYLTEIDSYSQIKSFGGTANNPEYWVVKTKKGKVIKYGLEDASQVVPQGTIAWSIREVNDTTGENLLIYEYSRDSHNDSRVIAKPYLSRVSYSGGRIDFEYEPGIFSYTFSFGKAFWQSKRLSKINIYTTDTLIKIYNITYQSKEYGPDYDHTIDPPDHIEEIQECDADGNCLNPTVISWSPKGEMDFDFQIWPVSNPWGNSDRTWTGDFNGDGLTDIASADGSNVYMRLSTGSGFVDEAWSVAGTWGTSKYTWTGDFNGDGLTDIASASGSNIYMYLSTGAGFESEIWSASQNQWGSSDYTWAGDFNGDGLTDIASASGSNVFMRLSLASGFDYQVWTTSGSAWGNEFTRVGDFNGDGLLDIASGKDSNVYMRFSTGRGFKYKTWSYDGHIPDVGNEPTFVGDFNGDGSADMLRYYIDDDDCTVQGFPCTPSYRPNVNEYMSTGLGFRVENSDYVYWTKYNFTRVGDFNGDGTMDIFSSTTNNTYDIGFGGRKNVYNPIKYLSFPATENQWGSASRTWVGDFNGDGISDVASADGGNVYVRLSKMHPRRVNKITDSYSNLIDISYKPLTDSSVYNKNSNSAYPVKDIQTAHYVVSAVESSNGVGGTAAMQYHYEGLKSHMQGRGSYGFAKIMETYSDTGKVVTKEFDQSGFPFIGKIKKVTEKYNGQIVSEVTNSYSRVSSLPSNYNIPCYAPPGTACKAAPKYVWGVGLTRSVESSYELGHSEPVITVATNYQDFDDFGNAGRVIVETTGGDQTFTKTTDSHYLNDTSNWYLGKLEDMTVTYESPYGNPEIRRSSFTYDNNTGLLETESVIGDSGLPLTTTAYTYDSYGQKTAVTLSASGQQSRTSTTTYNSIGQPTKSCNALNQCESYTYTPEGWLKTTTGPNGITTSWDYDGFGRKTAEHRADGTSTFIAQHFASSGECGELVSNLVYTCSISQSSGTQPAIVQYDALGRELRKITQSFDERKVYTDTEYNHLAQVTRVSRDYYMGNAVYWATSEYDALGRVTRMTEPGPHGSVNEITTEYNGLTTTVRSGPEARAKTTITNAIGQKIRIDEEEGAYTEYTYNSDGNLLTTRVAGDDDTIITLTYDEFGRKVAMNDPDMGHWQYTYTPFGELKTQRDAKGQLVTMEYDVLGRMFKRTEPEGISTWEYYGNSAPLGSRGKLYRESGNGLSKTYSYDNLGRPVSVLAEIDGEEGGFTTETSYYDEPGSIELGRVKRTTYPGSQGFFTENVYNDNGFLSAVRGLRSQAEQHDYSSLQPLISEATTLADDYLVRADKFRNLAVYYQSRIDNYKTLLANQTIQFETGTTAGLDANRAYDYLSAGDGITAYIRVPDTFIPIGTDIIVPIILPAEYHYRVTNTGTSQTITQITAAEFNAISATLTNTGDQVYVLNSNTITCACDAVGHDQYLANLQQHQALLGQVAAEGQATGVNTELTGYIPIVNGDIVIPIMHQQKSMALPPELLAHINNTLVELQTVQSLINQQAQSYESSAEQLVILAEQTLATADHNYQFVQTLDSSAAAYGDMIADNDFITYWRAVDVDASGRISAEVYGNGMVNDYAYNQATGQLQSIHSSLLVLDAVRHLEYQYDAYQNVTLRDDMVNDIRETFDYDRLDRLTDTFVSSKLYDTPDFNNTQSLQYDELGNITHKSDVGAYSYGAGVAGPHAVTHAGSNTYVYDANGNMTSGAGRTIQYSSFNKPTQITQNGRSATFSYGSDRSRFKKVNHKGDITLYLGGYERTNKADGNIEQKHYIYAAGQLVAEHIVSTSQGTQTRYLHKDALGSVDLVTDAYGNVVDRRSFDAWGKLRNLPWQSQAGLDDPTYLTQLPFTNKGFTGHEHVQEVDLIHMNGRMYDATLARFISADPNIQSPLSSSSYNRYSYSWNNGNKYVDPTGFTNESFSFDYLDDWDASSDWDFSFSDDWSGTSYYDTSFSYFSFDDSNVSNFDFSSSNDWGWGVDSFDFGGVGNFSGGDYFNSSGFNGYNEGASWGFSLDSSGNDQFSTASIGFFTASLATGGVAGGVEVGEVLLGGLRAVAGGGIISAVLGISGDSVQDKDRQYLYATYTRINPKTGQVYAGRTGGYGTPEELVYRRSLGQKNLTSEGFLPPIVDRFSTERAAIRGREQQLIDFYGGARSVGGTARNLINGVADFNPNRPYYMNTARTVFGDMPDNSPERLRLERYF
jgi:RHS repeat-associated protein